MNCSNCGAPMKLFRERDYYFCEHCRSYHFPDRNPQGLRILGENPEGMRCPRCRLALNLVTFDDFFQGYQCPQCLGLLFNRTTFREAIDFHRSRIKTPPDPLSRFEPAELDRVTYCSVCDGEMDTFQYNGPGNIVIDTCHPCDLIWLDYGELQKVLNAPGRDRGAPRKQPKPKNKDSRQEQRGSGNFLENELKELISAWLRKD